MKLALGTAQFGFNYGLSNKQGQVSEFEARAILAQARAGGMDTLDTAIDYGTSEQRLGEMGVKDWRIVSKLPGYPDHCPDISRWVTDSVTDSLKRLKIKRLYGLLLHRPRQLLQPNGDLLYKAILHLKNDGLVAKVGISIYDPDELDAICPQYHLDLVQAPFNILDRRLIDSGWLTRLSGQGTELHVRSVFLQGLLLMKADQRPDKFRPWQMLWQRWDAGLAERSLSPLNVCLAYALSFPEISRVVVGMDNSQQLSAILNTSQPVALDWLRDLRIADPDLLNPSRWSRL